MNWNDAEVISLDQSSNDQKLFQNRLRNSTNKKKVMFTKSSMMGALGVVPEENDSEENEGRMRNKYFGLKRSNTLRKAFEYSKLFSKALVEKQCFIITNVIFQALYVIIATIYFYMAVDIENDNIYAVTVILLAATIFLSIIHIFIVFGTN